MKTIRSVLFVLSLIVAAGFAGRATAAPTPIVPLAGLAYQPAQADATQPFGVILAFASSAGPSHVEQIAFVPADDSTCDDVDFRTVSIVDVDAATGVVSSEIVTSDTTCAGSGSWMAGVVAYSFPVAYDLPAGHGLVARWRPIGGGAATPSGAWRIE